MAPFSIPAPSIIPLRIPVFGGPRTIDTDTRIELSCETQLEHEIFYTLDGTKPQPYAGIVQGSKLHKYRSPLRLPPGKITIKAVALSSLVHSMRSSIITKTYEVLPLENYKNSPHRKKKKPVYEGDELNHCDDLDSFDLMDLNREVFFEKGEQIQEYLKDVDESLESSIEDGSVASVQEKIKSPGTDASFLFASARAEDTLLHTKDKAFISDSTREDSNEDPESEVEDLNENVNKSTYCCKCEALLQHCTSCNALSAISSKFCIQCGTRLLLECRHCKELNSVIASFCQSCGKKMEMENQRTEKPKSYAYNNSEFREKISEPMLSEFQSIEVVKTDDRVSITVSFSPFEIENDAKK